MPTYNVHVIIQNKPGISDPEGDTILNDLVLKGNNSSVKKISSGKILKFTIIAKNKKSAENTVGNICQELRIYNPLVSKVLIESKSSSFFECFLLFDQLIIYFSEILLNQFVLILQPDYHHLK